MQKTKFINPITDIVIQDDSLIETYSRLITLAAESKPTPVQSSYCVYTAGMTENGIMVKGSNHEHGITDTLTHGEEAVIAAALEEAGEEDPIKIIAFATLDETMVAPCGNCRDVIAQYGHPDLVIISGKKEGESAFVIPISEFYFDTFRKLSDLENIATSPGFLEALKAERTAYDIYTSPERLYGAAIITQNNLVFRGSFRGDVAYHAVNPLSAAIGNFRDGSDDISRLDVKEFVVVSTDHQPKIPYKERQHILEFVEGIQAYNNRSGQPLPIKMFQVNPQGEIIEGWETDSHQWYPFPFSPAHLGMENSLKKGIEKLLDIH
ncbi:hypothetical protein GOV03_04260 [Candidatus Woesearchaeota archaeon]|nr:hypothetical protein [Candidatus Woesearchaeota archaeon]